MATDLTGNLKISNPCPFLLMRMTADGDNYFCKGCSKTIVDFRGKSPEELRCSLGKDTCGIFNIEQLPGQQKMPVYYKFLFYTLTFFSFLGFSVKPLNAQSPRVKTDTIAADKPVVVIDVPDAEKTNIKEPKTEKSKVIIPRKKKKKYVMGCPDF